MRAHCGACRLSKLLASQASSSSSSSSSGAEDGSDGLEAEATWQVCVSVCVCCVCSSGVAAYTFKCWGEGRKVRCLVRNQTCFAGRFVRGGAAARGIRAPVLPDATVLCHGRVHVGARHCVRGTRGAAACVSSGCDMRRSLTYSMDAVAVHPCAGNLHGVDPQARHHVYQRGPSPHAAAVARESPRLRRPRRVRARPASVVM